MKMIEYLLPLDITHLLKMRMVVYLLINRVNGKYYIGKTSTTMMSRLNSHRNAHCEKQAISRAQDKYGHINFDVIILSQASCKDDLNRLETLWIHLLQAYNSKIGYNLTFGGDGGEKQVSPKPSKLKGKPLSEEHKQALRGRIFSEEHRKNLSLSRKNLKFKPLTLEHKKHIAETLSKLTRSDQQKKNYSKGSKSYWYSLTPEERSLEAKRRHEVRKQKRHTCL